MYLGVENDTSDDFIVSMYAAKVIFALLVLAILLHTITDLGTLKLG